MLLLRVLSCGKEFPCVPKCCRYFSPKYLPGVQLEFNSLESGLPKDTMEGYFWGHDKHSMVRNRTKSQGLSIGTWTQMAVHNMLQSTCRPPRGKWPRLTSQEFQSKLLWIKASWLDGVICFRHIKVCETDSLKEAYLSLTWVVCVYDPEDGLQVGVVSIHGLQDTGIGELTFKGTVWSF